MKDDHARGTGLDRRSFLRTGGAALAASVAAGCATTTGSGPERSQAPAAGTGAGAADPAAGATGPRVRAHRRLGRTGFEVSDVVMGCGSIAEPNVVRYACDRGVNLLDTAERYENGRSEEKIGQAMPHLERENIFLVTKLKRAEEDTEQSLLDRFARCLERLRTDYVDALYMHAVSDVAGVSDATFHRVAARLKADGKIKHLGISSHGPRNDTGDSLEDVLLAAVEDGRFDVMMLVYSFLKPEAGARVLRACRERDVGGIAMKVTAGVMKVEPFDPEAPAGEYARVLDKLLKRGKTRAEAIARIQRWVDEMRAAAEPTRPFMDAHGIDSEQELHRCSIRWALANPDAAAACVSMRDFDAVNAALAASGDPLTAGSRHTLDAWARASRTIACPPGCTECVAACPHGVPVNTIHRYAYYFQQRREQKQAMHKYAGLGRGAEACFDCSAPCRGACPGGLPIQASLVHAHQLLTLA
jgi:predicted aldo/keto reductase-like oxidoreductase